MRIQTAGENGCRVVSLIGSADIEASSALKEALFAAVEAGDHRVVCDLGRTDFICSDALGALITACLKARGRGGFVRLASPQPTLIDVLETTRLDRFFEVFPDVKAATAGA